MKCLDNDQNEYFFILKEENNDSKREDTIPVSTHERILKGGICCINLEIFSSCSRPIS